MVSEYKECPLCKEELVSKSHVREHIISHQVDKAYSCAKCDDFFANWGDLMEHLGVQHNESSYSERIHWNNVTTGELIKNICEDISSDVSNSESCRSSDISCPSPDSAIQGFLDQKATPLEDISEDIEEADVPERSPDSGFIMTSGTEADAIDAGSSGSPFTSRINLKRTKPMYVNITRLDPSKDYVDGASKKGAVRRVSTQEKNRIDEEVLDIFNESQGSPEALSRPDTPIETVIAEESEKENIEPSLGEKEKPVSQPEPVQSADSPLPALEPVEDQLENAPQAEVKEEPVDENEQHSESPEPEIEVNYSEGDIVWVWMKKFPIWPALISRSPVEEGGDFVRLVKGLKKGTDEMVKNYHCQFFGDRTERAWMTGNAIVNWEENMEPLDQFTKITEAIINKIHKAYKKKERSKQLLTVKRKLTKTQEGSFEKAIEEVKDALAIENIDDRIEKWGIQYIDEEDIREFKRVRDAERRKSEPKKTVTKKKSILPKTVITRFDELDWAESAEERNPTLLVDERRMNDHRRVEAVPVLMSHPERKEYKPVMHETRTITKELAERAISTLFRKTKRSQQKESPVKPLKKKPAEKEDVVGSKGDHKNVCVDCEEPSTEEMGGHFCRVCKQFFHELCQSNEKESVVFICRKCKDGKYSCFECNMEISDEDAVQDPSLAIAWCPVEDCGKVYHRHCLEDNKYSTPFSSKESSEQSYKCPHHNCKTCVLKKDDKKDSLKLTSSSKGKMFKCIRCPTAYHFNAENKKDKDDECVPAGSVLIAGTSIICPKHFNRRKDKKSHRQIHVNNCFHCFEGGNLIICDRCPAAYHEACLESPPNSDGAWFCPDCEKGSTIHYNDIVWAKIGNYRWWPSEVCHPKNIPDNIANINHEAGEFAVKFLGTNDYYWLNQHRCFLYKDIDRLTYLGALSGKGGLRDHFREALIVAENLFDERRGIKSSGGSLPFQKIIKNVVHQSFPDNLKQAIKKRIEYNLSETEICECHKRGNMCDEDCQNRQLQNECSSKCPNGDKCQNRRFTKRQYPPLQKFTTTWGGNGLKAKKLISKGTFIIEYVGEIISHEESRIRLANSAKIGVTNYYILELDNLRMIDAGPRGNIARFINHSCDPNCCIDPWIVQGDTRIGIFATRDIQEGEELTFNYQLQQSSEEGKTKCLCNSKNCAGYIGDKVKNEKPESSQNSKKSKSSKKRKQASRNSTAADTSISQVTKKRKLA